jgi:hypothetical protein
MCNLKLTIALSTCCGCANSSLVASSHTVLVLLVKLGLLSVQKYCAGMLLHVDKDKLHGNTYMQMLVVTGKKASESDHHCCSPCIGSLCETACEIELSTSYYLASRSC